MQKISVFKVLLFCLAATVVATLIIREHDHGLALGQRAPLETPILSYDGKVYNLGRFLGKPMIVNFWGTWCPPCVKELPVLSKLSAKYKDSVVFVGLAVDSPAKDVGNLIKRFNILYPVGAVEFSTVESWHAHSLPTTFAIDSKGALTWSKQGPINEKELERVIGQIVP